MQPNPFSSDIGARVLVAFLGGSVLYGMRHDLRQRALEAARARESQRATA